MKKLMLLAVGVFFAMNLFAFDCDDIWSVTGTSRYYLTDESQWLSVVSQGQWGATTSGSHCDVDYNFADTSSYDSATAVSTNLQRDWIVTRIKDDMGTGRQYRAIFYTGPASHSKNTEIYNDSDSVFIYPYTTILLNRTTTEFTKNDYIFGDNYDGDSRSFLYHIKYKDTGDSVWSDTYVDLHVIVTYSL